MKSILGTITVGELLSHPQIVCLRLTNSAKSGHWNVMGAVFFEELAAKHLKEAIIDTTGRCTRYRQVASVSLKEYLLLPPQQFCRILSGSTDGDNVLSWPPFLSNLPTMRQT